MEADVTVRMFGWGGARMKLATPSDDISSDVQLFLVERDGMHSAASVSSLPIRQADLKKPS